MATALYERHNQLDLLIQAGKNSKRGVLVSGKESEIQLEAMHIGGGGERNSLQFSDQEVRSVARLFGRVTLTFSSQRQGQGGDNPCKCIVSVCVMQIALICCGVFVGFIVSLPPPGTVTFSVPGPQHITLCPSTSQ